MFPFSGNKCRNNDNNKRQKDGVDFQNLPVALRLFQKKWLSLAQSGPAQFGPAKGSEGISGKFINRPETRVIVVEGKPAK